MRIIDGDGLGRTRRVLVVVSCSGAKLDEPAEPARLYTGSYTRLALRTAQVLAEVRRGVGVRILSARHGLLRPDGDPIAPYEQTMPQGPVDWQAWWDQRAGRRELEEAGEVLVLAGQRYLAAAQAIAPGAWRPVGLERARGIGDHLATMRQLCEAEHPWAAARGLRPL